MSLIDQSNIVLNIRHISLLPITGFLTFFIRMWKCQMRILINKIINASICQDMTNSSCRVHFSHLDCPIIFFF